MITQEELNDILAKHKRWIESHGFGERAFFKGQELKGLDFSHADLTNAYFGETTLTDVVFNEANLEGANFGKSKCVDVSFVKANCDNADFTGATLNGCVFRKGSLHETNFSQTTICGADMYGTLMDCSVFNGADILFANMSLSSILGVQFRRTKLGHCLFQSSDMKGSCFTGAELKYCCFQQAVLEKVTIDLSTVGGTNSGITLHCPEEGSFIAWKKVGDVIVKLLIPEDAKRSSATSNKCRASKVMVLGFYDKNRNELNIMDVYNDMYLFHYRKGEYAYPDSWDENRWNECSHGIHFFLTFSEAVNYPR